MSIDKYLATKYFSFRLGFFFYIGLGLLPTTTPVLSQTYGQSQPSIHRDRLYIAKPPIPTGEQSRAIYRFTFTNALEYSRCLDDILLLYENKAQLQQQGRKSNCLADTFQGNLERGLSKAQAQQIVQSANLYATTLLAPKLYPPRGQREQVARLLGFIYDIDKNDPTIHQLPAESAKPTPGNSTIQQTQPVDGDGW